MTVCAGCPTELPPNKAPGRARKWCSERCRKGQYAGYCVDCGAATNGSDGRGHRASTRCQSCATDFAKATAIWTRDRLIAEAQRWHDLTGLWPSSGDWCAPGSDLSPRSEAVGVALAAFARATGPWPSHAAVYVRFASWEGFMAAAGGDLSHTSNLGTKGRAAKAAALRSATP